MGPYIVRSLTKIRREGFSLSLALLYSVFMFNNFICIDKFLFLANFGLSVVKRKQPDVQGNFLLKYRNKLSLYENDSLKLFLSVFTPFSVLSAELWETFVNGELLFWCVHDVDNVDSFSVYVIIVLTIIVTLFVHEYLNKNA